MERVVVDADKRQLSFKFRELFRYRDLFWVLAYRDLRVRYAQTFLGLMWAFMQPLATLVIFTLVFGRAVQVDTGGVPYPLFALSGMVCWTYFAFVMNQSGNSIIGAQEMVKKIYFPRIVIPLSKAMVGFVDFSIAFVFLLGMMIYYGFAPGINSLWAPLFFILTVIGALGVGIWLSALTIRYRDFQHIVPFMVQIGLYVTPIAYPVSMIPEKYHLYYYLNPMAGIIEGFRWSLIGGQAPSTYMYLSVGVVLLVFVTGLTYFRKVERTMADIV